MASYNSIPHLNNGATANTADAMGLNAGGQQMGMGMGMSIGDPFSFDEALLDVNTGLDFTPSAYDFDNFTFEDPFSTTTSYPPLPTAHSQIHTHNHSHSHTAYNLPAVGGPSSHINVGPIAAEAEAALNKITTHEVDSPSDILDNKLLGFSPPIPSGQATLIDSETGRFADLNMTAELYGMFFVAEDVFASNTPGDQPQGQAQAQAPQGMGGPRPLELTCYRRNLWQCTGQITLPRHALHCSLLVNDDKTSSEGGGGGGRQVQIKELWASITALESIEGKQTEIISIPWKSSNPALSAAAAGGNGTQGQQQEEPSKTATTPPKQLLELTSGQEIDGDGNRVSIPVAWKRLQFKHATANNGRRKGLQQHYVVQINLLAKTTEETAGDKLIKLAEIQSGPVIVRGRSPRNFDSRRDVPLTGERKGMLQRTSTEGSVGGGNGGGGGGGGGGGKQGQQEVLQRFHSLPGNQPQDWSSTTPTPQPFSTSPNPQQQHPNKKLAMSSSVSPNPGSRPPIPSWGSSSSDLNNGGSRRANNNLTPSATPNHQNRGHQRSKSSTASIPSIPLLPTTGSMPISLSLLDDEQQRSPPLNRTSSGSGGENVKSPLYPKSSSGGGHVKKESISTGRGVVGLGLGMGTGQSMDLDLDFDLGESKLREQKEKDKEKETLGSPSLDTSLETTAAADLLYEYFPLSLDDWMPPVDAVYRPHVVHHTIVPPEIKAQQTKSRTKRYFAAE